jgi:hypothetical protein
VILFTIDQNQKAEKKLQKQMVELIEIALNLDGTFYLPYRNFSNAAQLKKGYPELGNFISIKKKWDSDEIFASGFYQYLLQSVGKTGI